MRLEMTAAVCHQQLALRLSRRGKLPVSYCAVVVRARRVRVEFERHHSDHMAEHVTRVLQPTHPSWITPPPPPRALSPSNYLPFAIFSEISFDKWLRGDWSCRTATIFSKGPDGWGFSKEIFCKAGNTSVVLPPMSSSRDGTIRGANSLDRWRSFTAVNGCKSSSHCLPSILSCHSSFE